jgi:C4-dicarboxylate-specific signal transduction histidine kinase
MGGSETKDLVAGLAGVAVIALADYLTGYEVRLAILYLLPAGYVTWKIGARGGTAVSIIAALCWLAAFRTSHPYSSDVYFYLEGAVSAASLLVVVGLLARLRQALERSDARFVTVLEGLEAAVVVADARTGALLYSNRRYREAFAAAPLVVQDSGEMWDERARRWHLVQSRPLRWTDGREAVLRTLSDVTEARRVRELVARHREEAHRASGLVALGEFASAIAHELSQPLAAIATYNNASLRLLEEGGGDSEELRAAMEKCRDQARRAGAIIQRLREVLRHP